MHKLVDQIQSKQLINLARFAKTRAYAPYSNFHVGSALLAVNKQIFLGCNIENSSYGETICAEKVAITKAISNGIKNFLAIAIVAKENKISWPCGSCRQVLLEFSPSILILACTIDGKIKTKKLNELIPYAFNIKHLE
jgi:cytidine deaminase